MELNKILQMADGGADGGAIETPIVTPAIEFNPEAFKGNKQFDDYVAGINNKSATTTRANVEAAEAVKLAAAKAQWEADSKLSEADRVSKTQKEYEDNLSQREKALSLAQMKLQAIDYLDSIGLPKSLADQVSADTVEVMQANANNLLKIVTDIAEQKKSKAIAGSVKTPQASTPQTVTTEAERLMAIATGGNAGGMTVKKL